MKLFTVDNKQATFQMCKILQFLKAQKESNRRLTRELLFLNLSNSCTNINELHETEYKVYSVKQVSYWNDWNNKQQMFKVLVIVEIVIKV